MTGIGAVVITRNEEDDIVDCLKSLSFCDERVVVDSFSEDQTVQRALPFAEHVYRRTFSTYGEQKQWGVDRLSSPWALVIDADERVTPQLAQELMEVASGQRHVGVRMKRRNLFYGRFLRGGGWGSDTVLRMYRKDAGRFDDRAVHEGVVLEAGRPVATCRASLVHLTHTAWPATFARLLSYSTRAAADASRRGRRATVAKMVLAPPGRFLRQYVLQAGFRDGLHGFVVCAISGLSVFLRWSKVRLGETAVCVIGSAPGGPPRVETVQGAPAPTADPRIPPRSDV